MEEKNSRVFFITAIIVVAVFASLFTYSLFSHASTTGALITTQYGPKVCDETDYGGDNPDVKGTTEGTCSSGLRCSKTDYCTNTPDGEPTETGEYLGEYYCQTTKRSTVSGKIYKCLCSNGACAYESQYIKTFLS